MVQLECTFSGQNQDGIWMILFSDGSGIEFPDQDSLTSYCDDSQLDVIAVESLRRVTAVQKFNSKPCIAVFNMDDSSGNVLKVI